MSCLHVDLFLSWLSVLEEKWKRTQQRKEPCFWKNSNVPGKCPTLKLSWIAQWEHRSYRQLEWKFLWYFKNTSLAGQTKVRSGEWKKCLQFTLACNSLFTLLILCFWYQCPSFSIPHVLSFLMFSCFVQCCI